MVKWDEKYREKGLVVIELYAGNIDKSKEAVERHIEEKGGAKFPIGYDAGGATTHVYGIKAFPVGYLIDVDGKVAWEGVALPEIDKVEKRVEMELGRVEKKE